jgi:hypothetical protein
MHGGAAHPDHPVFPLNRELKDRPDKISNYSAIEALSYLLGVKITKDEQRNLIEKYREKHVSYWRSRWLIQRKLEDFLPEAEITLD